MNWLRLQTFRKIIVFILGSIWNSLVEMSSYVFNSKRGGPYDYHCSDFEEPIAHTMEPSSNMMPFPHYNHCQNVVCIASAVISAISLLF
jgi:hypothetical protein